MVTINILPGHIQRRMAREQKMNGYGSMALGITLMVILWQLMVGTMLHGMVNLIIITLITMVTM